MPGTYGPVWYAWNQTYTSTTASTITVSYDITWANWQTLGTANTVTVTTGTVGWAGWNTAYEETAEQKADREERARVRAAQLEVDRAEREVANARAAELLRMVLSDEQIQTVDEHGWFEVIGSKGRRYRIRTKNGDSWNVDLMPDEGNERLASYCAHPPEQLPHPDTFVAQALALRDDEESFVRIANVHQIRDYRERAAA